MFNGVLRNLLASQTDDIAKQAIKTSASKSVLNKVLPTTSIASKVSPKIDDTLELLKQEALKYKNPDEFVNSKLKNFRDGHAAPSKDITNPHIKMRDGGDFSMEEVAKGFHNQPQDYFDNRVGARYYQYDDTAGHESATAIDNVRRALANGKEAKITVYRTIPKDVKQSVLQDYDWISPSKTYAIDHGENRFGSGEYRIISQEVSPKDLHWDGNDIREWGYGSGSDIRRLTDIYNQAHSENLPLSLEKPLSLT